MANRVFTNNAKGSLATGVSNVETTLVLGSGQGALFASPSGGNWQDVTLDDGTHVEICRMTARTGDTLTVTRAQEGTAAYAFSTGAIVAARFTAGAATDMVGGGTMPAHTYKGNNTGSIAAPADLTQVQLRSELGEKVAVLTDGATISVDASLANNFRVTLGGNRTLANPTNLIDGQVLNFRIIQDGTGSRTLAYGSKYKFPAGSVPVLSTAAGAKDFMSCQYDSTDDTLFCVLNKAFA